LFEKVILFLEYFETNTFFSTKGSEVRNSVKVYGFKLEY